MSNNESFIDEVNEEVRRDRLFGYFRKYGWLAVAAVVVLVGAAAWTEYQRAKERAAAEETGDAIIEALSLDAPQDVLAALEELTPNAVTLMLAASAAQEAGDVEGAVQILNKVAAGEDFSQLYKELATLKIVSLSEGKTSVEERLELLRPLAEAGRPFALLAKEQIAMVQIESGDKVAALDTLGEILKDAAVTQGLRDRSQQMIVALGGDLETLSN
ncbi:MAG: hypothetical protein JJ872_05770 [Marivivens sp.]|nr:hypothetical protein [Marivivens sp.]